MQTTFCDLRTKDVINVVDGKCLGHIIDMVFDCKCGKILGLIVPGEDKLFHIFKSNDQIFVPWCNICKIGEDVILVELYSGGGNCVRGCSTGIKKLNIEENYKEAYESGKNQNYNNNYEQNNIYTQTVTPDDYNTI
jgi:YlmC/YmxH family sporulation protein